MTQSCPFCTLNPSQVIAENGHAIAIYDGFPISQGHALIISKRHISSLFETNKEEREAIFELLEYVKCLLTVNNKPDGYNVGINDGVAAGQTVNHLHVHLIPRYSGDITDPRGGIRWIFPDKAPYWTSN